MIGVLGGTFDPVHEGHIHLLKSLQKDLGLEKILVVPAARNPHKTDGPRESGAHRAEMLRLALSGVPGMEVLDWEIQRPGPSYTVDTLEALHAGNIRPLLLIMGSDVYAGFEGWRHPERIRELAAILVVNRTEDAGLDLGRQVRTYRFSPLPISASAIRREIAERWKIDDLTRLPEGLSPAVWEYIKENQLYTERS